MESVLLLDTSVGSANKGDDIIMKCVRHHLFEIIKEHYVYTLPTHVSPFHWYQVARNSFRVQDFSKAKFKFVGGSNLLTTNMFTHFPQWNINLFNYGPLAGSVLVGVGAGKGDKINRYTRLLYKKVLSHEFIHSVRDERTKKMLEEIGLKAINTGCATLWSLTPEFCSEIPKQKSESVVFTLTYDPNGPLKEDQFLIDILVKNYKNVHFWVQGDQDLKYFRNFNNIEKIHVLPPILDEFDRILNTDIDYVGTRLHGGIFAMRHKKRSIIIAIDERARGMSETYKINSIDRNNLEGLESMINSEFSTEVNVDFNKVNDWLSQFKSNKNKLLNGHMQFVNR
ncbi:polysaccharide pyruvyl transferase family protein [Bacillus sp. AL-1R]